MATRLTKKEKALLKKKGRPKTKKEMIAFQEAQKKSYKQMAEEFSVKFDRPTSKYWDGWKKRICIAVPVTGMVRIEWVMARFGQVIPCNWSNGDIFQFFNQLSPMGWAVAEARNVCVKYFMEQGFEWLFFLDHDVVIPPDTFLKLNDYMLTEKYPVVSGIYFCKGSQPEPLIYRGRGNGFFNNFRRGEKVMVDGVPMGLTLIHRSVMEWLWRNSPEVSYDTLTGKCVTRAVFETPRNAWFDPEKNQFMQRTGTEDLYWCDRVINERVLEKCGNGRWKHLAKKRYPFLCDTSIFGRHIDEYGRMYPS